MSKRAAVALYERQGFYLALQSPRGIVLPGGSVEDRETPCEAAAREWQEETGARVVCMGPEIVRLLMGKRTVHVFVVQSAVGSLRPSAEGTPLWVRDTDLFTSVYEASARKILTAYAVYKKQKT